MLSKRHNQYGFNLVELMISLVLGLIVSGAVIAFIGSTIQSTNESVRATRLNQELRSLAEVIGREVRRARAISDPLANIGSGCDATMGTTPTTDDCRGAAIAARFDVTADCIRFGYQGASGGDFRSIRRDVVSGVGSIVMATGADGDTECTDSGTTINSGVVDVTALVFAMTDLDPTAGVVPSSKAVNISITGKLRGDPSGAAFEKTYQTTVFVRSGPLTGG